MLFPDTNCFIIYFHKVAVNTTNHTKTVPENNVLMQYDGSSLVLTVHC